MTDGYAALTEKEKQTLRLIARGHDAKSTARELNLSVHTVNERLRDARRKLSVASSREAARRLLDQEGFGPQSPTDKQLGEAEAENRAENARRRHDRPGRRLSFARNVIGVLLVAVTLALVALVASSPSPEPVVTRTAAPASAAPTRTAAEVEQAARSWLALLDQGRWGESFDATTESFKRLNTNRVWTEASEQARVPLGAVRSRTLIARESVPGPPAGYEVVKFRTDFANKANAVETVSLAREDGSWRIVGIYIE